jgi:NAD-dependent SIR2 family protein deacetylase
MQFLLTYETFILRVLLADFRAVATYEKTVHDHRTGRKCALCGGILLDSIVNFGDFLPADHLENARSKAKKADLCLVLGSSHRTASEHNTRNSREEESYKKYLRRKACYLQPTRNSVGSSF